jgi:hypothetical protein
LAGFVIIIQYVSRKLGGLYDILPAVERKKPLEAQYKFENI